MSSPSGINRNLMGRSSNETLWKVIPVFALPCTALITILARRGLQVWRGSRTYLGT